MACKKVGILANSTRPEALEFAKQVIGWLRERGICVCVEASAADKIGCREYACSEGELADTDLIVTLGGDGTILTASHVAAPKGVPILGVHMGHFGFIAETHPGDLLPHLDDVLAGRTAIEERMMLRGDVMRQGRVVFSAIGLNDVVLTQGTVARMMLLETWFGGEEIATYAADGVIVATPTGSTAYALSAGGPLVEPTVQALLVVPICPHTLSARPLVIPCDETVSVTLRFERGQALFSADGGRAFPLEPGDRVDVRRAEFCTRLVTLGHASFYRKVRNRLLWAERLNA
ncbi:MAG: NAD(+)/NADH kinase [Chthonomonadales bacterium]